jgi:hypothetical protein
MHILICTTIYSIYTFKTFYLGLTYGVHSGTFTLQYLGDDLIGWKIKMSLSLQQKVLQEPPRDEVYNSHH